MVFGEIGGFGGITIMSGFIEAGSRGGLTQLRAINAPRMCRHERRLQAWAPE